MATQQVKMKAIPHPVEGPSASSITRKQISKFNLFTRDNTHHKNTNLYHVFLLQ